MIPNIKTQSLLNLLKIQNTEKKATILGGMLFRKKI